jgi:hypothetical protein
MTLDLSSLLTAMGAHACLLFKKLHWSLITSPNFHLLFRHFLGRKVAEILSFNCGSLSL